ncbi:MAG: DNA-processing protein DprA [Opitutaceae bacterium]|nr:DNA-processing protein DprA [Opitutaceae bacterium]
MAMEQLTERQAFLVLNALPDIGPITTNRLLAALGDDPRRLFEASARELESVKGVGPKISGNLRGWRALVDLEKEEARLAQAQASFVSRRDPAYPPLLRELADAPLGLYRRGEYGFDAPCVAIVGSRRTTLYGQATAKKLGYDLARRGFCVVSGLARGIDTQAHEGALEAGGITAAVLGNGIDIIYPPENLKLYQRIEERGAILTEFPFGRRADKQSFAMRNRIVAGMCRAVIVVESDVSGGSMITAKFAGEQGRLVFAVPGRIDQPSSAGCHQLIRDGATLLTSVEDVVSELDYLEGFGPAGVGAVPENGERAERLGTGGVAAGAGSFGGELGADEARVLGCFAGGAILTPDAVTGASGLASPVVTATLMMLELKRRVVKRTDGAYEAR